MSNIDEVIVLRGKVGVSFNHNPEAISISRHSQRKNQFFLMKSPWFHKWYLKAGPMLSNRWQIPNELSDIQDFVFVHIMDSYFMCLWDFWVCLYVLLVLLLWIFFRFLLAFFYSYLFVNLFFRWLCVFWKRARKGMNLDSPGGGEKGKREGWEGEKEDGDVGGPEDMEEGKPQSENSTWKKNYFQLTKENTRVVWYCWKIQRPNVFLWGLYS